MFRGGLKTGLFDCFQDMEICLPGFFLPSCLAAFNKAEINDRECHVFDWLCQPNEYLTRQQMRARWELEENQIADCITLTCCTMCMICQDARELELRVSDHGQPFTSQQMIPQQQMVQQQMIPQQPVMNPYSPPQQQQQYAPAQQQYTPYTG